MTHCIKTSQAYTWTKALNTPFWALYTLLPFILCKDLQASTFQIACLISLKPIVSCFSLYWSAHIKQRCDRLKSNIIWANILGHLPFLFVPWIDNPWYLIFASATYMLFYRGVNPAWMEVLKLNIAEEPRKTIFAYGAAFYHAGGAILAILIGWLLDDYHKVWQFLFPLTVLIAFCAIVFQLRLTLNEDSVNRYWSEPPFSLKEQFQNPWKEAWMLLKQRPDFARFQIGFMLGGGGLMLWQPALPQFFFEVLHLNYKELTFAMIVCKTVGYTLALPFWSRAMNQINLFTFTGTVTAITIFFPLGLVAAQWHLGYLYAAYLIYGIMQAGSELSWNLSGPLFSKHEDSSTYTGVNVVSIGLRGCLAPPIGSALCSITNSTVVLLTGGGFCLLATWYLWMGYVSMRLWTSQKSES